tara:strand:- start:1941 stop:2357 length:417 start_codon:yes stop_codon:yes gene_type:complete
MAPVYNGSCRCWLSKSKRGSASDATCPNSQEAGRNIWSEEAIVGSGKRAFQRSATSQPKDNAHPKIEAFSTPPKSSEHGNARVFGRLLAESERSQWSVLTVRLAELANGGSAPPSRTLGLTQIVPESCHSVRPNSAQG